MESRKSVFLWGNFITLSVNKYHLWFKTTLKKVLKYKLFSIYLSLQDNIIKWRTFRRTNDYAGHLPRIQDCTAQIQDSGPKRLNTNFAVVLFPRIFCSTTIPDTNHKPDDRSPESSIPCQKSLFAAEGHPPSPRTWGRAKNW